jgi:hypothetical protein
MKSLPSSMVLSSSPAHSTLTSPNYATTRTSTPANSVTRILTTEFGERLMHGKGQGNKKRAWELFQIAFNETAAEFVPSRKDDVNNPRRLIPRGPSRITE